MQERLIRVALEALEGSTGCDQNGIHPVLYLNEEIRKLIPGEPGCGPFRKKNPRVRPEDAQSSSSNIVCEQDQLM